MTRAFVLAAVLLCAFAGGSSQVRAGKPASVVVFTADHDVVVAAPDGKHSLRITFPGFPLQVAPSLNGRELAIVTDDDSHDYHLFVRTAANQSLWHVADSYLFDQPAWSPDSRRLGFISGDRQLEIAMPATRRVRRISVDMSGFAWSPDGRTVAFTTASGVSLYDVRSAKTVQLPGAQGGRAPVWTPDGRSVVYLNRDSRLTVMPVASGARPWTGARAFGFQLSPDGTRIAYWNAYGFELSAFATGSRPTTVAPDDVEEFVWSPDSRRIAFSRPAGTLRLARIFVAGRNGRGVHLLVPPDPYGGSRDPVFSPDGSKLAYDERSANDQRIRVLDLRTGTVAVMVGSDPDTSSYEPAVWTAAAVPLPPTPSAVPVSGEQQAVPASVFELAADDGLAAVLSDLGFSDPNRAGTELLWTPLSAGLAQHDLACPDEVFGLTVAGDRLAWICGVPGQTSGAVDVYLATTAQPDAAKPAFSVPCCDVTLAGAGGLLVESVGNSVFRIERSGAQTLLRSFPATVRVLAVSENRILLDTGDNDLDALDQDGNVIAAIRQPHRDGAALAGDRIAALDRGNLRVLTLSGQPVSASQLPRDAYLQGLQNGVLAYTSRLREHLLRLADGSDVPVDLPGQFDYAWAGFTEDGSLFYAYNSRWPTASRIVHLNAGQIAQMLAQ